jgi:hypothetical protein
MKHMEVASRGIQKNGSPVVFENLNVHHDYPHTVSSVSSFSCDERFGEYRASFVLPAA